MKLRHSVVLALLLWSRAPRAMAAHCEQDALTDVSESGAILETTANGKYRVDPADRAESSIWNAGEDVIICPVSGRYVIIHKDDGHAVNASRLE